MDKTPKPRRTHEFYTNLAKAFLDVQGLAPMDVVRLCGISVGSAYKIHNAQPVNDLNVLYRVYDGLRKASYVVTWKEITGIE